MTICFIGHREVLDVNNVRNKLLNILKDLMIKGANVFLFGSNSQFNSLCLECVNQLKTTFTKVKRIYVRSAFAQIDKDYEQYLLGYFDETYFPQSVSRSTKVCYIQRNKEMIDRADLCIFYYNKNYLPPIKPNDDLHFISNRRNSGTLIAYRYAVKKNKNIINVFEECKV